MQTVVKCITSFPNSDSTGHFLFDFKEVNEKTTVNNREHMEIKVGNTNRKYKVADTVFSIAGFDALVEYVLPPVEASLGPLHAQKIGASAALTGIS